MCFPWPRTRGWEKGIPCDVISQPCGRKGGVKLSLVRFTCSHKLTGTWKLSLVRFTCSHKLTGTWKCFLEWWSLHVSDCVTVLGSFRETALVVEAGLTGGYVPAHV
jgi:hypothetical protein